MVNGEILSLSLLLEDALMHGAIDIHELTDFDEVPNYRETLSDASNSRVARSVALHSTGNVYNATLHANYFSKLLGDEEGTRSL